MIITLAGSNDFARSAALNEHVGRFIQLYGDSGLERVNGEDIEFGQLLDLLQAGNLFAAERMIIVRELSANKSATEKLDAVIAAVDQSVSLIIVEPNLDMRTSYAKMLQKKTEFKKFEPISEMKLPVWVVEVVGQRGGVISRADAQLLVERVGINQQTLSTELDKLLAYDVNVTAESIQLLTEPSPRSSIFDLLAAAFNGKTDTALKLYQDQRDQKMEPQAILSMIAWQLHILLIVKLGGNRSPQEIASDAKMSPFVIRNSTPIARSISIARLHGLLSAVINVEMTLKSKALNADDAVQDLLMQIAMPETAISLL